MIRNQRLCTYLQSQSSSVCDGPFVGAIALHNSALECSFAGTAPCLHSASGKTLDTVRSTAQETWCRSGQRLQNRSEIWKNIWWKSRIHTHICTIYKRLIQLSASSYSPDRGNLSWGQTSHNIVIWICVLSAQGEANVYMSLWKTTPGIWGRWSWTLLKRENHHGKYSTYTFALKRHKLEWAQRTCYKYVLVNYCIAFWSEGFVAFLIIEVFFCFSSLFLFLLFVCMFSANLMLKDKHKLITNKQS